jgi:hypothetical protein
VPTSSARLAAGSLRKEVLAERSDGHPRNACAAPPRAPAAVMTHDENAHEGDAGERQRLVEALLVLIVPGHRIAQRPYPPQLGRREHVATEKVDVVEPEWCESGDVLVAHQVAIRPELR